jgi:hypothetical protein
MSTSIRRHVLSAIVIVGFAFGGSDSCLASISVDPSWTPKWTTLTNSNLGSLAAIEAAFVVDLDDFVSFQYKANFGEAGDSGPFASSYTTSWVLDDEDEPTGGFVMDVVGEDLVDFAKIYLIVKDGNQTPAQYLFDISVWDGTDIELSGFWDPGKGSISHIEIWGGGVRPPPTGDPPTPEPTSVAVWSLLVGVAAFLSSRSK